jgi:probable F420-dependent oxidoreductase
MSVRIGLGIQGFPFSDQAEFWRWVDFCEDSAVDSLWCSDRLVSAQPTLEPMALLAALAGRTQRLKFGMNVVVLPFRDPLVLAKQCATIDFLSKGRLLPAFGVGNDTAPEWAATGRPTTGRGTQADEIMELLRRLWSEERVTFSGKHYHYTDVTISPRPLQAQLPMWMGGSSEAAINRTAKLATGWLGSSGQSPAQAGQVVRAIRTRLQKYGRTIEDDHYGIGIPFRFGRWDEPVVERSAAALASRLGPNGDIASVMAVGDAEAIAGVVQAFVAAGLSKFVLRPIAASGSEVLEQSRLLEREVIPTVHAMSAAAVA